MDICVFHHDQGLAAHADKILLAEEYWEVIPKETEKKYSEREPIE
jgi:hypothetical protein